MDPDSIYVGHNNSLKILVKHDLPYFFQKIHLNQNLNFFLSLLGREKVVLERENPADIKAATQLGKLYDQLLKEKRSIVFEVKTYNLPSNENIVLYGAKNKRYIK